MQDEKDRKIEELEEKLRRAQRAGGFLGALIAILKSVFTLLIRVISALLSSIRVLRTVLLHSHNHAQRTVAFVVATEVLFLAAVIVHFLFSELHRRVDGTTGTYYSGTMIIWCLLFIINIAVIVIFFFRNVRVRAMTYLGAVVLFGALSLTALHIGHLNMLQLIFFEGNYLIKFAGWQMWNAILISAIGVARTLILGLKWDYQPASK